VCTDGEPLECYDSEFGSLCETVGCDPALGCVGIPIPGCADAGPVVIPDGGLPDAEPGPDAFTPFAGQLGGGGCGCQSGGRAGDGAGAWLLIGALALLLRRRRAVAALILLVVPITARAQGFDAQIFRPAPALTGFVSQDAPDVVPSGSLHVVLTFDAADDPLVLRDPASGEVLDGGVVLSARSSLTLGAALGLPGNLELSLAAPLALAQSGDLMLVRPGDELESAGLGDLRAGVKWRFLAAGPMRFALAVGASFPTGSEDELTGAGGVVVTPRLVLGAQGSRVAVAVNFGYSLREAGGAGDLVVDDEFLVGGGVRVDLTSSIALVAEAYGAFGTQGEGNEREAPVEALAGPRVRLFGPWVVQAGAGVGVTHGYGTPAVRGYFALAYAPRPRTAPIVIADQPFVPVDEPENDEPVVAAPSDRDGDGLPDASDQCPDEPEDKDGVDDEDGCPDPDADGDGIADKDDKCPNESEIVNGVDDEDGCPDEGLFELVEDRIVLEEKVLFDTNRARVKSGGKRVLSAVVVLWKQHPEWGKMVIEGHTDERGTDEWNLELGKLRAERVRDALIEAGFPPERLEVVSYGRSKPRDPGKGAEAWEKNRRVEFVIVKQEKVPVAPGTKPDAAPVP
jgi:MYXO-CTERM domain-containing protein